MNAIASRWTTPRRLRAYVAAAWLAALLVFAVALQALRADRAALRTIARKAAPNIVVAEELGAHLADLDTELANSLLGNATERDVALQRFEDQRAVCARKVVDAASATAGGDANRLTLVALEEDLGRYFEMASRARALFQAGDRTGALAGLHIATDHMHARILPAALALDRADRDLMDREYGDAVSGSRLYEGEAIVCGMLLVGVLVSAQVFVRRATRRRLVPVLLAATLLAGAFTVYLVGCFRGARENLRIARDDAFDSIHVLWRASAVAYDARGDESRWLLDAAHGDDFEIAFRMKMKQLVSTPGPWRVGSPELRSGRVTGLLVDEARNVTFPGEAGAVDALMAAFTAYVGLDDTMRSLERQGRHADAVDRCVGPWDADARAAFDRLDVAMQKTIGINQRAFDAAAAEGDAALARAEWLDPAFAIGIAVLAWLGVRVRLREYA